MLSGALACNEAPSLAAAVAAGTLPPVDERLPESPLVLEPLNEIGAYGGAMRTDLLGGTDRGYGWLNRIIGYEPLVRFAPEGGVVVPNIAESWEANADSTEFTFHLRPGMKWSDGAPVTADDITFWYEDMALNEELFPGGPGGHMLVAGEPARLEKIDDLTVKFAFTAPFGLFLQQMASGNNLPTIAPRHYGEQFHPSYNPDGIDALIRAAGVTSWVELFTQKVGGPTCSNFAAWVNPELPSLHPWLVTQPYDGSSTQVVARRNPYYWKVDTADNQLPYIDEVVFTIVGDSEVLKLMTMNGQVDFVYRPQNFGIADKPVLFDNQEAGDYRFIDLSADVGAAHAIHLNLTVQDPVRQALFTNKDFRIALSHAIDREELIEIIYVGQGEALPGRPAARVHVLRRGIRQAVHRVRSRPRNQMLDALGLTGRNGQGIRADEQRRAALHQVDGAPTPPSRPTASSSSPATGPLSAWSCASTSSTRRSIASGRWPTSTRPSPMSAPAGSTNCSTRASTCRSTTTRSTPCPGPTGTMATRAASSRTSPPSARSRSTTRWWRPPRRPGRPSSSARYCRSPRNSSAPSASRC